MTLDEYFVNMNGNVENLKAKYFSIFNIVNFPKTNLFQTIRTVVIANILDRKMDL